MLSMSRAYLIVVHYAVHFALSLQIYYLYAFRKCIRQLKVLRLANFTFLILVDANMDIFNLQS